jgi:hypothetical protein
MIQVYRLLQYSNLVTDLHQPKVKSETTVGGVLKRQTVCDFAMDATGGAAMDDSRLKCGASAENTGVVVWFCEFSFDLECARL